MLIFNEHKFNKYIQSPVKKISMIFESKGTTTKQKRLFSLTEQNQQFLKSLGLKLHNE